MPLGPHEEGTLGLNNIMETGGERHKHSVDVGFVKEGCRSGDSGWDANLSGLVELALVTHIDIPLDILFKQRPPEVVKNGAAGRVEAFMTKVVMGIMDEVELLRRGNVELMPSVVLPSPELAIKQKKVHHHPKKFY